MPKVEETVRTRKSAASACRFDLEKSLSAYGCAAAAAGVSLLALVPPSAAEVVYTPAHTKIPVNNSGFVALDLNHDGIVDFAFWNLRSSYFSGDRSTHTRRLNLYVGCAPAGISCQNVSNAVWGRGEGHDRRAASALPIGFSVRPDNSNFQQYPKGQGYVLSPAALMDKRKFFYNYTGGFVFSSGSGSWANTTRYVGLRFVIESRVHYGWARVAVKTSKSNGIVATITGYAYETIPDKPIVTGAIEAPAAERDGDHSGSLGQLALGASGNGR